ncbi:MAG: 16S rRNA (cytosine(1402)-N(4))-methyltransferase RsmH [Microgenomates group bacterium]
MPYPLHTPVMLDEVLSYLEPSPGKRYIDATLGYAGHALGILKSGAEVVGIDRDGELLDIAIERITKAGFIQQFTPIKMAFSEALDPTRSHLAGKFDGILFDLGVSSYQLDTPERGFSFRYDAPLDMRMDKRLGVTAADLIGGLGKNELVELFETLGEESNAKRIASAICSQRLIRKIETTEQLSNLIIQTVGRSRGIHPATKVFQALRMAVNSERLELKAALPSALSYLKEGGVIAAISFHSLEDRIVKSWMNDAQSAGQIEIITKGVVEPGTTEVAKNPRSRSAKLRIAKRIA